ncbi:hypothetical protein WEU38_12125 [Cyanobacterium aponinum AL20118]|uniref:Uncharacterized protein n=1 Tax=Cyanobacterium aponinum AL20115 TaxID=3090662 RepID=A0AAF0Z8R1_9CHRO|nr:hypothetical protein [Cyanobacterium aponinum]WPF87561.1 hypothetical protein SAY89_12180 [Cyanobacterium aponinum AL20115]
MNKHDIEKRWYEFINSLPKPTQHLPNYQWGLHWTNISPHPVMPMYKKFYCDVRYWINDHDRLIMLISQDDDNPSMSITNACEHICTVIYCKEIKPFRHPLSISWFESYSCYTYPRNSKGDIGFSKITFSLHNNGVLHSPKWKYYSKDSFKTELFSN